MSKRPNQNTLSVLRKKIKEAQVKLKRANQKLVRSEKSAASQIKKMEEKLAAATSRNQKLDKLPRV